MDHLIHTLTSLGLNRKEAEIYFTLLTIGNNPASTIARKAGHNRSSCYAVIEKLIQKGFVKQINKNTMSYFSPIEPKYILGKLKTEYDELENKIEQLQTYFIKTTEKNTPPSNKPYS